MKSLYHTFPNTPKNPSNYGLYHIYARFCLCKVSIKLFVNIWLVNYLRGCYYVSFFMTIKLLFSYADVSRPKMWSYVNSAKYNGVHNAKDSRNGGQYYHRRYLPPVHLLTRAKFSTNLQWLVVPFLSSSLPFIYLCVYVDSCLFSDILGRTLGPSE